MSNNLNKSVTKIKVDKSKETLLDRLYDSYLNEEDENRLSDSDKAKRSQIEAAWSLLINYNSLEQSVPLLMSRFDISRATAYRILNYATKLFGDVTQTSKEGMRHILYEYSMRVFQLAARQESPDLKQMNTAIKNMAMLKGLNGDDTSAFDAELLQAHTYLIQIASGAGKDPLTLNVAEIQKLPEVEYEEVVDSVESMGLGDESIDDILDNKVAGESDQEEEDE